MTNNYDKLIYNFFLEYQIHYPIRIKINYVMIKFLMCANPATLNGSMT